MDYIYLLKEREFIKTGENIFKIGRSSQFNDKRIKQYPKGSMILLMIFCGNSKQIEIFLINKFKEIFIQRKDIGVEYFEGCLFKMREIIIENLIKLDNLTIEKFKQESLNKLNKTNDNIEVIISEKKRIDELNELKIKSILEKENRKEEKRKKKEEINKLIEERKKYREERKKEIIEKLTIKEDDDLDKLDIIDKILPWFKETYEQTNDKEFIRIKKICDDFLRSSFCIKLSRVVREKYNKNFFLNYFDSNIFFREFYADRCNNIRSVIKGWKVKINDEQNEK